MPGASAHPTKQALGSARWSRQGQWLQAARCEAAAGRRGPDAGSHTPLCSHPDTHPTQMPLSLVLTRECAQKWLPKTQVAVTPLPYSGHWLLGALGCGLWAQLSRPPGTLWMRTLPKAQPPCCLWRHCPDHTKETGSGWVGEGLGLVGTALQGPGQGGRGAGGKGAGSRPLRVCHPQSQAPDGSIRAGVTRGMATSLHRLSFKTFPKDGHYARLRTSLGAWGSAFHPPEPCLQWKISARAGQILGANSGNSLLSKEVHSAMAGDSVGSPLGGQPRAPRSSGDSVGS
ncbi:hypothetical protein P7K49_002209 [Saguinus oedipus]|uniref:Uncharacterized protein n=1 Tax=Saguinus oedipus TaxID=9490 RepID=A0ABQ9WGM8_SAGOE|nr:hypothetical protein P7K49_002209 [Saguinus oedipus]